MDARLYLVSYDIACAKRWRRVQKVIKGICRRGQLSVFICRASGPRIERLERELRLVMHQRDDRLMILDLGPAHSASPQLVNMNSITDLADLGAAIL